MRVLVTGSAGHLGDALVQELRRDGHTVTGLDALPSPTTDLVASITDRDAMRAAMAGVDAVVHSATLHQPHVSSHGRQDFIDVNLSGTLVALEEAVAGGVSRFVFLSSTSAFVDLGHRPRVAPGTRAAGRLVGWEPRFNFGHALQRLAAGKDPRSDLALAVGSKGYHETSHGI